MSDHGKNLTITLIAAIAAITIGIELSISFTQSYAKDSELLSDGLRAIGTVVKKEVSLGDSESFGDTFYFSYTFSSPSGEQINGHSSIGEKLWQQMDVGSPIEIVYDPLDPSHNLLVAADRPEAWAMIYLVSIGVAIGSFGFIGLVLLFVRWEIRMIRRGHNGRIPRFL